MAQGKNRKLLTKKIRKGDKGHPIATIAFYGPDSRIASKVVCAIIKEQGADAEILKKWFSENDVRKSEKIFGEILAFIDENEAKSVAMMDRIIGCPHEEGIDYPDGEYCPKCNYWKRRDRFTHEMVN